MQNILYACCVFTGCGNSDGSQSRSVRVTGQEAKIKQNKKIERRRDRERTWVVDQERASRSLARWLVGKVDVANLVAGFRPSWQRGHVFLTATRLSSIQACKFHFFNEYIIFLYGFMGQLINPFSK